MAVTDRRPWLVILWVIAASACSAGTAVTPPSVASTTAAPTTAVTSVPTATPATATPMTTAAATPTIFAVIGDYGDGGTAEAATAGMIRDWSPDYVMTVGDNAYGSIGYDAAVGRFFAEFIGSYHGDYGPGADVNRFFPALGNHDYTDAGLADYEAFFSLPGDGYLSSSGNERYYDVVLGPIHLFIVDSDGLEPDGIGVASVQASWLRAGLAASTEPWQVVVFHHAPYGSAHHRGEAALRWPLAEWGADLVLNGHNHNYERFAVDGITYATVGIGIANVPLSGNLPDPHSVFFFGDDDTGALRLTACARAVVGEFATVGSGVIDRFSIGSGDCSA